MLVPLAAVAACERDDQGRFLLTPQSAEGQLVAQEMLGTIVTIARTSTFEFARINAAVAAMNRIWGAPKETVDTTNLHQIISDRPLTADEWADKYAPKNAGD